MKNHSPILFVLCLVIVAFSGYGQQYILNEDFSTATGTTPPLNWQNATIVGQPDALWHFDNPGNRTVNFPVTSPFAILDAPQVSPDTAAEVVILETPSFDASTGLFYLLFFDHYFFPDSAATARILAYDGSDWIEVASYNTATTTNPTSEVIDLTATSAGVTDAKLRFEWTGHGKGYWAIDNVRVYSALYLDAGISAIDSPVIPFDEGLQDFKVTLENFGYDTLTAATIKWSVDDEMQPEFNWTGTIPYGSSLSDISIGSYDFESETVHHVKIWSEMPNGYPDPNPHNDSTIRAMSPALCGAYTIGGVNPDFQSFSAAVTTLIIAGVSCPVIFNIRTGTYLEQIEFSPIPGSSAVNTVTFQSESGDSSTVMLKYQGSFENKNSSTITINQSGNIVFKKISLLCDVYISGIIVDIANNSHNIQFKNCYFKIEGSDHPMVNIDHSSNLQFEFNYFDDYGYLGFFGSFIDNLVITNDIHNTGSIQINNSKNIDVINSQLLNNTSLDIQTSDTIFISNNLFDSTSVICCQSVSSCTIINNRIVRATNSDGIHVTGSHLTLANNYIQTNGELNYSGIVIDNCIDSKIVFNSVNVGNINDNNSALLISGGSQFIVKNNIFVNSENGYSTYVNSDLTNIDWDFNDYFSATNKIGYINGTSYHSLERWINGLQADSNSLCANPFYTTATNLSINQILLNNAGVPIQGVMYDIDSTLRNPDYPDIGAKEYDPCPLDAGINFLSAPTNPIEPGLQQVKVILQNQGMIDFSSVTINWEINGNQQTPFDWAGSLSEGMNTEVAIGTFDFPSGTLFTIKAWTGNPNGLTDCNSNNDTCTVRKLATILCGEFTIGGQDPNFSNFSDAVMALKMAGISCPVVFKVRSGTYLENIQIDSIAGTSAINTITFRSESGDSSLAILKYIAPPWYVSSSIALNKAQNLRFEDITIISVNSINGSLINIINNSNNIIFKNCNLELYNSQSTLFIASNSAQLKMMNCTLNMGISCQNIKSFTLSNSRLTNNWRPVTVENSENIFIGDCDLVSPIQVSNTDSVLIINNKMDQSATISSISNIDCVIQNNRIFNVINSVAIDLNSPNAIIANNFIQVKTIEIANATGILVGSQASGSSFLFNSIIVLGNSLESSALRITGGNNYTVKNNIFTNFGNGIIISVNEANDKDWNNNAYFSPVNKMGVINGIEYYSLNDWSNGFEADSNSLYVNPFFTADTNLSINQILLNNTGIPIQGILYDIDSTLRNSEYPDMGAKEYTPCTLDAGINLISAPTNPIEPGLQSVNAILQNHGTTNLSLVTINWEINGFIQLPFIWAGSLDQGMNAEVTIGSYDFSSGSLYTIRAWTQDPNDLFDCNSLNDTCTLKKIAPGFCGEFTIGGQNPNFLNFSDAVLALKLGGISCPVVFKVRPGIYPETIQIDSIAGTSAINTITFESESKDSSMVKLKYSATPWYISSTVIFNNAKFISFKDISLESVNSINGSVIKLGNHSENIHFEECNLNLYDSQTTLFIADNSSQLELEKCSLNMGISCVKIDGFTLSNVKINSPWRPITIDNSTKIRIDKCQLETTAIQINNSDSLTINENILNNSSTISVQSTSNCLISNNKILNVVNLNAIEINSPNSVLVNNLIHSFGDLALAAIKLSSAASGSEIVFNSINLMNNDWQSRCLDINDADNLIIKNNIFSNKGSGYTMYISTNTENSLLDYNNYFNVNQKIGFLNGNTYSSLPSWSTAISGEANGRNLNPYFVNNTSYKIYQCGLNGAGIPIPGVIDDIESELRNALAPDIGCDEFDFPYYLFGIVFHDVNQNGIQDEDEFGLPGRLISVQPGNIIAMTDSTGVWADNYVPPGTYVATAYVPEDWALSTSASQEFFFMDTTLTNQVPSFGMYSTSPCPKAEVTLTAPELVRCFPEQRVYVSAKNDITATGALTGGYVDIQLDPLISLDSATLTYTSLGDNKYRFNVGDLNPGREVNFGLSTTVSCSAMNGQTLCMQANIYPVDSCAIDTTYNPSPGVSPCMLPWDNSSIEVEGWCEDDTVHFSVTNTGEPGEGDMVCYSPVRVYLDGVLVQFDSIQLAGGQTVYYDYPGYGRTWRLEADQHPLRPGNSHPNASLEACGDTANWTPGLINLFPMDDADPTVDIYCGMTTGVWEAAEKTGYPIGIEEEGYILPDQGLQYMINFRNTGGDTAKTVVIRDTLDINLNIFTVLPGASSHPYTFRMFGPRVLEWRFDDILLPPGSVSEEASKGFLTFTVQQNDSLESGTEIFNKAEIYFEFLPAARQREGKGHPAMGGQVGTNQTHHTINDQLHQPILQAYTLNGRVSYYNSAHTALNDVRVILQQENEIIWTDTTNPAGEYSFPGVLSGTYDVLFSTGKASGGQNSTDAAQANYWGVYSYPIEKVKFYAGDVSLDNFLSAYDAQRIQRFFVFGTPFNRAPWTFWKAGDLVASNADPALNQPYPGITLFGGNAEANFYGLSTGDFNESYIPLTKSAPMTLRLIQDGKVRIGADQEFELPLRLVSATGIGAISLIMTFPDQLVQVMDVFVTGGGGDLDWTVKGNELRIGWNSGQPLFLAEGANLVILKMRTTGWFIEGNTIQLALAPDPLNELADETYDVIGDALLSTDVIQASGVGVNENPAEERLLLSNYPNPFDDHTMIRYSLPFDGRVTLEIYGPLGNRQIVLVDAMQSTGEYTLKLNTDKLAEGIYTMVIRLASDDAVISRSIKLLNHP